MVGLRYRKNTVLIITALLFFYVQFVYSPAAVRASFNSLAEPVLRQIALGRLGEGYDTYDSKWVDLLYTGADSDNVKRVLDTARKAFEFNHRLFGYEPGPPATLVVFPDGRAVEQALTGTGNGTTSGFYWAGVIGTVSPREWDNPAGPLYHEMAHLFLEKKTWGNIPVWFSEGMAQYAEYLATGRYWLGDEDAGDAVYSYAEMRKRFTALPDQYSAYREAFMMTRQMMLDRGRTGALAVLDGLAGGEDFDAVFKRVYGDLPEHYFLKVGRAP